VVNIVVVSTKTSAVELSTKVYVKLINGTSTKSVHLVVATVVVVLVYCGTTTRYQVQYTHPLFISTIQLLLFQVPQKKETSATVL